MAGNLSISEMTSATPDAILTVVTTCKGNLKDPCFPRQLQCLVGGLRSLLCTENKALRVTKLEPWNSVRVTFQIPRDAAHRLRQLAQQGDRVLRDLGILSVQLEGDQVISLTIAGRFNEPQEIVLRADADAGRGNSDTPSLDLSGSEGSPGPSNVETTRKNIAQYLSQQGGVGGSSAVTAGSVSVGSTNTTTNSDYFLANSGENGGREFKSPNVVAPGSDPLPFPPPRSRAPGAFGPFPFASMTHAAINTMHGHHQVTTPPASSPGSTNNAGSTTTMTSTTVVNCNQRGLPPPPYPGSTNAVSPVGVPAVGLATYGQPATVNNVPRTTIATERANVVLSSPLLVNLLQNDAQQVTSGGRGSGQGLAVNKRYPVSSAQASDGKRKKKGRGNRLVNSKDRLMNEGIITTTSMSTTTTTSTSSPSPVTSPMLVTPLSSTPTPPPVAASACDGYHAPLTLSLATPSPPSHPVFSTAGQSEVGSSSQDKDASPWPSPSKRTHLINPFTGQLEPMSSEDSMDSVPSNDILVDNVQSKERDVVDEDEQQQNNPVTADKGESPPPSSAASSMSERSTGSPGEKIKLRLKLETKEKESGNAQLSKNKPEVGSTTPNVQYKVDVSFVNIPTTNSASKKTGAAAACSTGGGSSSSSTSSSSSVSGGAGSSPGSSSGTPSPGVEPRVPPLHISLRGRNAMVVGSSRTPQHSKEDHDVTLNTRSLRCKSPRTLRSTDAKIGGASGGASEVCAVNRRVVPRVEGGRRGRPVSSSSSGSNSGGGGGVVQTVEIGESEVKLVSGGNGSGVGVGSEGSTNEGSSKVMQQREKALLSGGSVVQANAVEVSVVSVLAEPNDHHESKDVVMSCQPDDSTPEADVSTVRTTTEVEESARMAEGEGERVLRSRTLSQERESKAREEEVMDAGETPVEVKCPDESLPTLPSPTQVRPSAISGENEDELIRQSTEGDEPKVETNTIKDENEVKTVKERAAGDNDDKVPCNAEAIARAISANEAEIVLNHKIHNDEMVVDSATSDGQVVDLTSKSVTAVVKESGDVDVAVPCDVDDDELMMTKVMRSVKRVPRSIAPLVEPVVLVGRMDRSEFHRLNRKFAVPDAAALAPPTPTSADVSGTSGSTTEREVASKESSNGSSPNEDSGIDSMDALSEKQSENEGSHEERVLDVNEKRVDDEREETVTEEGEESNKNAIEEESSVKENKNESVRERGENEVLDLTTTTAPSAVVDEGESGEKGETVEEVKDTQPEVDVVPLETEAELEAEPEVVASASEKEDQKEEEEETELPVEVSYFLPEGGSVEVLDLYSDTGVPGSWSESVALLVSEDYLESPSNEVEKVEQSGEEAEKTNCESGEVNEDEVGGSDPSLVESQPDDRCPTGEEEEEEDDETPETGDQVVTTSCPTEITSPESSHDLNPLMISEDSSRTPSPAKLDAVSSSSQDDQIATATEKPPRLDNGQAPDLITATVPSRNSRNGQSTTIVTPVTASSPPPSLSHVSMYTTSVSTVSSQGSVTVPMKLVSIPSLKSDHNALSPQSLSVMTSSPFGSSTPAAVSPALAISPPLVTQGPASPMRVFVSRVCPISCPSPGLGNASPTSLPTRVIKSVVVTHDPSLVEPVKTSVNTSPTMTTPVTTTAYSLLRANPIVTSVHASVNAGSVNSRSVTSLNRTTIYPPSMYGLTRAMMGHLPSPGVPCDLMTCAQRPLSPASDGSYSTSEDRLTPPEVDSYLGSSNSMADHNYVSRANCVEAVETNDFHYNETAGESDYGRAEVDSGQDGGGQENNVVIVTLEESSQGVSVEKEEEEEEEEEEVSEVPSTECKPDVPVGDAKLGLLTIDIPENNDADDRGRCVRNTRSNSRVCWSPVKLTASPIDGKVSSLPVSHQSPASPQDETPSLVNSLSRGNNNNKRRRDESPKEPFADGNSEGVTNKNSPQHETTTTTLHYYSKPVKRRCSENAAELIKACMGVEDTPKRGANKHRSLEDLSMTKTIDRPTDHDLSVSRSAKVRKEDLRRAKGVQNAMGSGDSSDDEMTLSELANKSRGKGGCRGGTSPPGGRYSGTPKHKDTRNERGQMTNTRFNSRGREDKGVGRGFRESRRDLRRSSGSGSASLYDGQSTGSGKDDKVLQHSTRGSRSSERARKSPPKGREKSPLRGGRGRGGHERGASPSPHLKDEGSNKRKTRSSGTTDYYDPLPQKRRRYSRDHR